MSFCCNCYKVRMCMLCENDICKNRTSTTFLASSLSISKFIQVASNEGLLFSPAWCP